MLPTVSHKPAPELVALLDKTRDTNLLYLVLEKGEKTVPFRYSRSPSEHPVLKDLGTLAEGIQCFYLKTARYDRPIKVDTLSPHTEKLASILLAISGQHPNYGIPAPLIEADNVAKLSEQEMENFYSQIISLVGNTSSAMRLRREQRPF